MTGQDLNPGLCQSNLCTPFVALCSFLFLSFPNIAEPPRQCHHHRVSHQVLEVWSPQRTQSRHLLGGHSGSGLHHLQYLILQKHDRVGIVTPTLQVRNLQSGKLRLVTDGMCSVRRN